jgi:tetratricopeptide (TPR) repeat protein
MKAAIAVPALLLALGASEARAQVGRVAGTVTDDEGRPLKGATITAENRDQAPSTFTSSSDAKGRFSLLGMRRGFWVFTIQAPGFEKAFTRLDIVTTRPNPPLDVRMARAAPAPTPGPLAGIDAREVQRRIDAAESLAAAGDHAAAIAVYRELLVRVPVLTSIYLQIGALHERLQDTAAALAAYKRLAELEPDNARARAAIQRLGGR